MKHKPCTAYCTPSIRAKTKSARALAYGALPGALMEADVLPAGIAALHSSLQSGRRSVMQHAAAGCSFLCAYVDAIGVVHEKPEAAYADGTGFLSSSEGILGTGGENQKEAAKIDTNEDFATRTGLSQASCSTAERMEFVDGLSDPWVDSLQLSYPADEEYLSGFQVHQQIQHSQVCQQIQHKRSLGFNETGRRCKAKWAEQTKRIEVLESSSQRWAWEGTGKQVNKWNYNNHVSQGWDNSNVEWTQLNNNDNSKQRPLGGMIFGCNKQMWKVCKKLHLFGLPAENAKDVLRVVPGTKLFLFNFETKNLIGAFEATSNGGLDIVPNGFFPFGQFPAQVRVKRIFKYPDLPVAFFRNAIRENFSSRSKFRFDLTAPQVEKLLNVFKSIQKLCC